MTGRADTARVLRAYRMAAAADYRAYVHYVHEGRWIPGRAVSHLCREVQRFLLAPAQGAYDILLVSMPPQHGKSMSLTETLPSWYLGRWPDRRAVVLSYNDELAVRFGRANKRKLERFGGALFGVRPASDLRGAGDFEVDGHAGGCLSRGVMAGVTGRPADLMIIDDPVKNRQEADSETYRDRIWNEWQNSFKTRLSAGAKVIVIQTRWHEDDLTGRILATEPGARLINLPCEAEENDPLGRAVGDALCPEIGKDGAWLRSFKAGYVTQEGTRAWNALFQGRPTAQEGGILRREWWRYYDALPKLAQALISVDATFKGGADNDFVAAQVWGKVGADCYLLDAVTEHWDFPQTLAGIQALQRKWPQARLTLVEDKANGPAVVQMLGRKVPGVVAVNPEGGKVARVNAVSPAIESGHVFLPRLAAFTGQLVEQCAAFPQGVHDDMVDAMSQALNRLLYFAGDLPAPEEEPDEYAGIDFLDFGT